MTKIETSKIQVGKIGKILGEILELLVAIALSS